MLERTKAITNEVLESITFVLAYSTVYTFVSVNQRSEDMAISDLVTNGHITQKVA
jgi:hypothetical protein